ncbi:MAG: hypothetical protein Q9195_004154 [Heterodermia aff. obscurata]
MSPKVCLLATGWTVSDKSPRAQISGLLARISEPSMASFLLAMWHPLIDAPFAPFPLPHRCRLLFLLPVSLILYTWKASPYILSRPYVVCQIPTRRPQETIRALVYNHPSRCSKLKGDKKRPLHIDIHGGGFIGGIPEEDVPFCTEFANTTGAVVVSLTYRLAPRHPFPAAHDDVADSLAWLVENCASEFEADSQIVTVSGFSAGGNLALGATLGSKDSHGEKLIKGAVTFYNPVDLRLPPQEKRKPPGFPSFDLFWFLTPLFDAYAGPNRMANLSNPKLHPTLASPEDLPDAILFVISTVDFLLYEQLDMVERLNTEIPQEKNGAMLSPKKRRYEKLMFEGQLHGWLERQGTFETIPTIYREYKNRKRSAGGQLKSPPTTSSPTPTPTTATIINPNLNKEATNQKVPFTPAKSSKMDNSDLDDDSYGMKGSFHQTTQSGLNTLANHDSLSPAVSSENHADPVQAASGDAQIGDPALVQYNSAADAGSMENGSPIDAMEWTGPPEPYRDNSKDNSPETAAETDSSATKLGDLTTIAVPNVIDNNQASGYYAELDDPSMSLTPAYDPSTSFKPHDPSLDLTEFLHTSAYDDAPRPAPTAEDIQRARYYKRIRLEPYQKWSKQNEEAFYDLTTPKPSPYSRFGRVRGFEKAFLYPVRRVRGSRPPVIPAMTRTSTRFVNISRPVHGPQARALHYLTMPSTLIYKDGDLRRPIWRAEAGVIPYRWQFVT